MITIGYPPDQVGGTEIYVQGLIESLRPRGYVCHVGYLESFEDALSPDILVEERVCQGTPVHVVRVNRVQHRLESIQFDSEMRTRILQAFVRIADQVSPDIVHVHPLNLGFHSYIIERLKRDGYKVVLTYHSSNTGCSRGDLLYLGAEVCDGRIDQYKCTRCLYHSFGLSRSTAVAAAAIPLAFMSAGHALMPRFGPAKKLNSFFSIPLIVKEQACAWSRAMTNADTVVAVCHWVRELILCNRVPRSKIMFSRHGLRIKEIRSLAIRSNETVCFGYLGRIGPEKGIGVLLAALESMPPDIPFRFEFCSSTLDRQWNPPPEQALVDRLRRLAAGDKRIVVRQQVGDEQLANVLASWDALIAPSLWLESGPQVIYEAFCVKTPVIGSDRGGISELVEHNKTGFLVPPNDADALRNQLLTCSRNPTLLRQLRGNIASVRTTNDVANDMDEVYSCLLSEPVISIDKS